MSVERKIRFRYNGIDYTFIGTLEQMWETYPNAKLLKIDYVFIREDENRRWRDIPNHKGLYQCSNFKDIKSLSRIIKMKCGGYKTIHEKILKPNLNKRVILTNNKKEKKSWAVNELYALTFKK